MALTLDEVEHIAHLARIELTEDEKARFREQMSSILDYVDLLNEVDTEGVEATAQVTGLENVYREDAVMACDEETRKQIIENFPDNADGLLRVKGVFS